MSNSDFISGLAATATPVRPRRLYADFAILAAIAGLQILGASLLFGQSEAVGKAFMMDGARMQLKFWLFGLSGAVFAGLALWSLYPGTQRVSMITLSVAALVLLLAVIGFDRALTGGVGQVLDPGHGIACLISVVSLSLPVTLILSLFMVRGASTQPNRTAFLVGLAGGSWGAFTYALQCPFVGLWYLALWYMGAVLLVALAARVILPRLASW